MAGTATSRLEFRGLDESNRLAVCSCGHVDAFNRASVESRRAYLEREAAHGLIVVVAHLDGRPAGFVEAAPIEAVARDVEGEGALFLHCVTVFERGRGVGRALVEEVSRRAAAESRGLVVDACAGVYGFMPVEFFERLGFRLVEEKGRRRLLSREPPGGGRVPGARQGTRLPRYTEPRYVFRPAGGKVVVDVFFTPLCDGLRSPEGEAARQAAAGFGDRVLVREYNCGDPAVKRRYGIARAVFVDGVMRPNGDVVGVDEMRDLIRRALGRRAGAAGERGGPKARQAAAGRGRAVFDDTISRLF